MTTKTPDQLRQEAADCDRRAEESFQRCDTDGFLSQWASGVMAHQKRKEADLVEAGGFAYFRCLLDAVTGEPVPVREIKTRYDMKLARFASWMDFHLRGGEIVEWIGFSPRSMKKAGLTWGQYPPTDTGGFWHARFV